MSNRYLVKCPQFGCGWSGLTTTDHADPWPGSQSPGIIVALQCPCCHHEWQGRVMGGKVRVLPQEGDEDMALALWPPVEFGVGD